MQTFLEVNKVHYGHYENGEFFLFVLEDRNNNNHKNVPATFLFKYTTILFLLHVLDTRLFLFWTSVLRH